MLNQKKASSREISLHQQQQHDDRQAQFSKSQADRLDIANKLHVGRI